MGMAGRFLNAMEEATGKLSSALKYRATVATGDGFICYWWIGFWSFLI